MKKLLLVVTIIATFGLGNAYASYCTQGNWNTAVDYYKKRENRHNLQTEELNKLVVIYNDYEFLSSRYNAGHLVSVWKSENTALQTMLITQKDLFNKEIERLDRLKREIVKYQKLIQKSADLWDRLADYCYDEDKYKDYKSGRNNMRAALKLKGESQDLVDKIDKMRVKYLQDIGIINKSKQLYDESLECGCNNN